MIQILGLLGMYFNAVVVEVKTFLTFIQIDSGHTVNRCNCVHQQYLESQTLENENAHLFILVALLRVKVEKI